MKVRILKIVDKKLIDCNVDEVEYVELKMPCEIEYRLIPVHLNKNIEILGKWFWNGDVVFPTLKPSILSRTTYKSIDIVCHSFVTNGIAIFLSDCTHNNENKKIELLKF